MNFILRGAKVLLFFEIRKNWNTEDLFFTEKSNENLHIQKKNRTFANRNDKKSIKIIKTLQIIQFIHN